MGWTRALFAGFALALIAALVVWTRQTRAHAAQSSVVFSRTVAGCPIVVPADANAAELRAAALIGETLARAAGREPKAFPVVREDQVTITRGLFVGATRQERGFWPARRPAPFDDAVGFVAAPWTFVVSSERRDSIEIAASWFLEETLGARWFMPGALGDHIPRRDELRLAVGRREVRPGFLSRSFGGGDSPEEQVWSVRNRLETRFGHNHSYATVFTREDLLRNPLFVPVIDGQKYLPRDANDYRWQPNIVEPAAAMHAAEVIEQAFAADSQRMFFSLCENDTVHFDESPATLARVSPLKYFRGRPNYSDLVFGFTNAVADAVRARYPDRWITAYAYQWCENTPSFPIVPNVVPILTADRSQWFDPAFAAEDRALIERWCRSGAKLVGVYDYFYGAPYVVPRPTLYAVSQSIPFEAAAGVKIFYAECYPNWGLDGPKLWLAAQLLWAPQRDPAELLAIYYRDFWQEAAEPMRAFYERCDRAWLDQPKPGWWIRYYQDEHQALLFDTATRAALRNCLEQARQQASSAIVRARVDWVAQAYAVSGAFAGFCEARDQLSRLAAAPMVTPDELLAAWRLFTERRETFVARYTKLRAERPLAISATKLDELLRNDPSARVARRLRENSGPVALVLGATPELLAREGEEQLRDAGWRSVQPKSVAGPTAFEWLERENHWRGNGLPSEHRVVEKQGDGMRFAGCRDETLSQWSPTPAVPGALYTASVKVRAHVGSGNMTYLVMSFMDEKMKYLVVGGYVDRVPVGQSADLIELRVTARAPAGARYVGMGLRICDQSGDDFAEFSEPMLRRLE